MNKDKIHPLEILPVKRNSKEKESNIPQPIPGADGEPFTLVMLAPTASGKSVVIVNVIYRYFKKNFNEIIYISPTCLIDKTLSNNVSKDDEIIKIHDDKDLQNIDHLLKVIEDEQKETKEEDRPKILIVLDDMISYFKRGNTLDKLPAMSRHYNISFIITSQSYTSLPPVLRKNATYYMIFRMYNKKELDLVYGEIGANYEDFDKYYKECIAKKYSFMLLDNKKMEIYKNFTDKLWEKNKH